MSKRDVYRYHFRRGRLTIHTGTTDDLERREREHRRTYGYGNISQVGAAVTPERAIEWEKEQRKKGRPVGP